MRPALRAVCDRYIVDTAYLLCALDLLDGGELRLALPGDGRTAAGVVLHAARALDAQATAVEGFAAAPDRPLVLAAAVAACDEGADASDPDPGCLAERLALARDRILAALVSLPAETLDPAAGGALMETLDRWSLHSVGHGLELAIHIARIRTEPLLLSWVLFPDFRHDPAVHARQRHLFQVVRKAVVVPEARA